MHLQAEHSTHINVTPTIPTEMYLQRLCRIRWGHSKLQWLPQSVVCRHLPGQGSRNSNCDVSDPFYSPMTAQGPQCIANHVLPGNGEPLPDPGMALISNILCTGKACHLRVTSMKPTLSLMLLLRRLSRNRPPAKLGRNHTPCTSTIQTLLSKT